MRLAPWLLLSAAISACAEEGRAATRDDPDRRVEAPETGEPQAQDQDQGAGEEPASVPPDGEQRDRLAPSARDGAKPEGPGGNGPHVAGLMRGLVRGYDFRDGRLELDSDGSRVAVRAHPADARALTPGEAAAVEYANFGGRLWVVTGRTPRLQPRTFTRSGTVRAPVQVVDRGGGVLVLGGQRLRAHPLQLAGIAPGMFVEASFVRIESQEWLADVAPRSDSDRSASPRPEADSSPQSAPADPDGYLSGAVVDRDLARGRVRVRTDGDRVEALRASPADISDLEEGDAVALPHTDHSGTRWLDLQQDNADFHGFDRRGRLTGAITHVDGSSGALVLRGRRFHAHPRLLGELSRGDFATVRFARTGASPWIIEARKHDVDVGGSSPR